MIKKASLFSSIPLCLAPSSHLVGQVTSEQGSPCHPNTSPSWQTSSHLLLLLSCNSAAAAAWSMSSCSIYYLLL